MPETPAASTAARLAAVPMPARIANLPRDKRGYPVPRFVSWRNGEPDFRLANGGHLRACVNRNMCWICGGSMGRFQVFVIGPTTLISRVHSEPPSHRDCAEYAVKVCPFLAIPNMKRLPKGDVPNQEPAGHLVPRNPGVVAMWTTGEYKWWWQGRSILFQLGEPSRVEWWRAGREATRAEVEEVIRQDFPAMLEETKHEANRAAAIDRLQTQFKLALQFLPGATYNESEGRDAAAD